MDRELFTLLNEANDALLAAGGAYSVLESLELGNLLPGVGHTKESNSKIQNKVEDYLKKHYEQNINIG